MAEQPPAGFDPAIAAYYDRAPEESRLEYGAFRLEEVRTRELIERHAPPSAGDSARRGRGGRGLRLLARRTWV
jgi:hypothetical protein